jgi:hypothetical protein
LQGFTYEISAQSHGQQRDETGHPDTVTAQAPGLYANKYIFEKGFFPFLKSLSYSSKINDYLYPQKCAKRPFLSAEDPLPDHSAELFADGRRALQAVKGTLRSDFQANSRPRIFS